MRGHNRLAASAMVGGLLLLCTALSAHAQIQLQPVRIATLAPGAIDGIVLDEKGLPVFGAMVSALGATTSFATTDKSGRFELRTLSPGPYLVRAHLTGFVASRGQYVDVRPSSRTSSSIALRRVGTSTLAAGLAPLPAEPAPQPVSDVATSGDNDDHSETAWRLRHARRSILKDAVMPEDIIADDAPGGMRGGMFDPRNMYSRALDSSARLASVFASTPFTGQVNLLTTGSFDGPQQFFTTDSFSHGVAYMAVSAPVGSGADWTVRGAVTQSDLSSWIVAGSYTTHAPARHRYELGVSYAIQRYDGGNPAALRGVTDGSRNAGAMYGFDTFAVSPAVTVTYGSRYARYDYLADRSLFSPRVGITLVPAERTRINAIVSSRASAPGAEEFLPPAEGGIWLPPQRTFSSIAPNQPLDAERTTHVDVEVERDLAAGSTLIFRAFRQHVTDQMVTMFGVQVPGTPAAELGHYFVGNAGTVDATGWTAGVRTALAERVHASLEYSLSCARWMNPDNLDYLVVVAPSAIRLESERIHNVSTSVVTDVPETATRIIVLYRVSNAFAHPVSSTQSSNPELDTRFDVQVRQSLPFMNFSNAHWEMLLAVRNFFRETAPDQSLYDELFVVRPPKRVVGGLTLRF